MKTYEVLERALGDIQDEKNWCQGMEENLQGARCAIGSIHAKLSEEYEDQCLAKYVLVRTLEANDFHSPGAHGFGLLADFNDTHSHAEVVALFQQAIRNEKAKAGVPLDVEAGAVVV
jgi:hypothetical protein